MQYRCEIHKILKVECFLNRREINVLAGDGSLVFDLGEKDGIGTSEMKDIDSIEILLREDGQIGKRYFEDDDEMDED